MKAQDETPRDDARWPAVLLLGPTGVGKTPLGEMLEARGLHGQKCVHFDFGANLREAVAQNAPDQTLCRADLDFLRATLESGALLEDDKFYIAERLLQGFLARRGADCKTWVILNGLPRHEGQAAAIATTVAVRAVICLTCSPETVFQRIAANVGGDRTGRRDDDLPAIRRKLQVFEQRTVGLREYYRRQGTPVEELLVTSAMTLDEMWHGFAFFSRHW